MIQDNGLIISNISKINSYSKINTNNDLDDITTTLAGFTFVSNSFV